jgi:hypothetical protein
MTPIGHIKIKEIWFRRQDAWKTRINAMVAQIRKKTEAGSGFMDKAIWNKARES